MTTLLKMCIPLLLCGALYSDTTYVSAAELHKVTMASWSYDSTWRDFGAASARCKILEARGYETYIKQGSSYVVYYR